MEFFELIEDKVQEAIKELFQHGDLGKALPSIGFYKEHKNIWNYCFAITGNQILAK